MKKIIMIRLKDKIKSPHRPAQWFSDHCPPSSDSNVHHHKCQSCRTVWHWWQCTGCFTTGVCEGGVCVCQTPEHDASTWFSLGCLLELHRMLRTWWWWFVWEIINPVNTHVLCVQLFRTWLWWSLSHCSLELSELWGDLGNFLINNAAWVHICSSKNWRIES